MATTYLIKLETIQFDELDCNSQLIPTQNLQPQQIQIQDPNGQFLKTISANECQTIDLSNYIQDSNCSLDKSNIYNYDGSTMQIVQLENPIDLQNSMETMSDTSSSNNTNDSSAVSTCDKIKAHQRKLNKYVRIRFRETFGNGFLLNHDLHECDQEKFEKLKKEAMALFKPPGVSERTAWARAKQSLRLMRNAMLKS